MIRRACYALLLSCCTAAFAQPLYKWVEADGSITFSPHKPPATVNFQVIESGSGITASRPKSAAESALATNVPKPAPVALSNNARSSQRSTNAAFQRNSTASIDSEARNSKTQSRAVPTRTTPTANTAATTTDRKNRCEELRKRVVSLERRLKAQLTAEDMDNTVIYMSKYQKSYDKFCVQ